MAKKNTSPYDDYEKTVLLGSEEDAAQKTAARGKSVDASDDASADDSPKPAKRKKTEPVPVDLVEEELPKPEKSGKSGAVSAAAFYVVAGIAIVALLALAISIFTGGSLLNSVGGIFKSRTPVERGDVVMTVGEFEVSADEYLYNALSLRSYYEQSYGAGVLATLPAMDAQLKDYIVEEMQYMAAQLVWAKELGIELTAEEKAAIDADIQSLIDEQYAGVKADFIAAINGMYITEDFYHQLSYRNAVLQKLSTAVYAENSAYNQNITAEDRARAEELTGVLSAKHILIARGATEAEDVEKKALVEDIYAQLQNGADFDTLMDAYTEDTGIAEFPDGYVFYPDEFVPEFTEATQALAYGAMSGIVESEHGWHIIVRLPVSEAELNEMVSNERINTRLEELMKLQEVSYARGYDAMTIAGIQWKGEK